MKTSVALCTYNGEGFIRKQIESILNQKVKVDEIVICDDASTDNTLEIIEEIARENSRIISIYKSKKNVGAIKNFEKSISLTSGEIIFLSDQDDIWKPEKTEKIIGTFVQKPKTLMIFTDGELIDQFGKRIDSTIWDQWGFDGTTRNRWKNNKLAFEDLLVNRNKVTGATVAFNKKLKKYSIPILVPKGYWHDAYLALNASALEGLIFIEECLIEYRIHKEQQIGVPNNYKENFNENNFCGSISFFNFMVKNFIRFNSWNLRKIVITTLTKSIVKKVKKKLE